MKIRLPLALRTAVLSWLLAASSYTVHSATLTWYDEYNGSLSEFTQKWWNANLATPAQQNLKSGDSLIFDDLNPSSNTDRTGLQNVNFGSSDNYGSFTLTSGLNWNIATAGSSFDSVSITAAGKTITLTNGMTVLHAMSATGNIIASNAVTVGGDLTLGSGSTFTGTNLNVAGALANGGTITLNGGTLKTESWTLNAGGNIIAKSFTGGTGTSDMEVSGTSLSLSDALFVNSLTISNGGSLTAAAVTSVGNIIIRSGTSLTSNGALNVTVGGLTVGGTATSLGPVDAASFITVSGVLDAKSNAIQTKGALSVSGTVKGGAIDAESIRLTSSTAKIDGTSLTAANGLTTVAGSTLNLSGALTVASGNASVLGTLSGASDMTVTTGGLITDSSSNITISGLLTLGNWSNQLKGSISVGKLGTNSTHDLSFGGTVLTVSTTDALALKSLSLSSGTLTTGATSVTLADGLTLNAGTIWNANGSVTLSSGNASVLGTLSGVSDMTVTSGGLITDSSSNITISGLLALGNWNNLLKGSISVGKLGIDSTQDLSFEGTTLAISSTDALALKSLSLSSGTLTTGATSVTLADGLTLNAGTIWNANGSVTLSSGNASVLGTLSGVSDMTVHGVLTTGAGTNITLSGTLALNDWSLGQGSITVGKLGTNSTSALSLNGTNKLVVTSLDSIALQSLSLTNGAYLDTAGSLANDTIAVSIENGLNLASGTTWDARGEGVRPGRSITINAGGATLNGTMWARSLVVTAGGLTAGGNITVTDDITVTGTSTVSGSLLSNNGSITINGDIALAGTINAKNNITLNGALTLTGNNFNLTANNGSLAIKSLTNSAIGGGTIKAQSLTFNTVPSALQLNGTRLTLSGSNTTDWGSMDLTLASGANISASNTGLTLKSLTLGLNSYSVVNLKSLNTVGDLNIYAGNTFNVAANSMLTVGGDMVNNLYSSWGTVNVGVTGNYSSVHILNAKSVAIGKNVSLNNGAIGSAGALTIGGDLEMTQSSARTVSGQTVAITGNATIGTNGTLSGTNNLTINGNVSLAAGSSLLATNGVIQLGGTLTTSGTSDKHVTITAKQLLGSGAAAISGDISLTYTDLTLTDELKGLSSTGSITLTESVLNIVATLNAGATTVDAASQLIVGKGITLASLDNFGQVSSTTEGIIITGLTKVQAGGTLFALTEDALNATISTGNMENAGEVKAYGSISITGDLTNSGMIQSLSKDISITGNATLAPGGKLIAATQDEESKEWMGTGVITIGGTLKTNGTAGDGNRVMIIGSKLVSNSSAALGDISLVYTDLILTDKTTLDPVYTAAPIDASKIMLDNSLLSSASGIKSTEVILLGNSTLISTQKNYTYSNNPKPEDYPVGGNKPGQIDMVLGSLTVSGGNNTIQSYGNLVLGDVMSPLVVLNDDALIVNAWGVVTVNGGLTLGDKSASTHNTISFQGAGITVNGALNVAKDSTLTSHEGNIPKEDGSFWPEATRDYSSLTVNGNLDYQGTIKVMNALTADHVTGSNGGTLSAGNTSTGGNVSVQSIRLEDDLTSFASMSALNVTHFFTEGGVQYAAWVQGNGAKLSSVNNMDLSNGELRVDAGSTASAGGNLTVGSKGKLHNITINGTSSGYDTSTKVSAGSDLHVYGNVSLTGNSITVSAKNIFVYDATPGTLGTLSINGAGNTIKASEQFRVFALDLKDNAGNINKLTAGNSGMYIDTSSFIGGGNSLDSSGTIQFKGSVETKGIIKSGQSIYFEGGLAMTAGSITSGDTVRFTSLHNTMTGGSLSTPNWEILSGKLGSEVYNPDSPEQSNNPTLISTQIQNTYVNITGATKISGDGRVRFDKISGVLGDVKVSGPTDATLGSTKNRTILEIYNSTSLFMSNMSIQNADVWLGRSDGTNSTKLDTLGDRKGIITLNKGGQLFVNTNSTWAGSVHLNDNSKLVLNGGSILGDVLSTGSSSELLTNNITFDVKGGGVIRGNVILDAVKIIGDDSTGKTVTVDGNLIVNHSTPADALKYFSSTALTYSSGQHTVVDAPPIVDTTVEQIGESVMKVIIEGDSMLTLGKLYSDGYHAGTIPHEVSIRFGDLTIVNGNYNGNLLFEESNLAQNNANVSRKLTISTDTTNAKDMIVLASGIISVSNDTTFTLNGYLRGDSALLIEGGGKKIFNQALNATQNYTADMTWMAGDLQLGGNDAIGTKGTLIVKSTTGQALT